MQDWLGKVVDRDDLTRHDKWCCMMLPRLKLLRELLRDDGAIFVSVDDNEVHRLRCLMDEVFGEENFVATALSGKKIYSPKEQREVFVREPRFRRLVYAREQGILQTAESAPSQREDQADCPIHQSGQRSAGSVETSSDSVGAQLHTAKERIQVKCPSEVEKIKGPSTG